MAERVRVTAPDPLSIDQIYDTKDGEPFVIATHKTLQWSKSIVDYPTPGYAKKLAEGAIINNPCTLNFSLYRSSGDGYRRATQTVSPWDWHQRSGGTITDLLWAPLLTPPSWWGEEPDASGVKLQALANMDKPMYEFGEDVGEIGSTLRFLKNPIESITKLTKKQDKLRRSLIRKGATGAKASADAYATYQWAYKPLVQSASNLAESLLKKLDRPPRKSARSRATFNQEYDAPGTISKYHGRASYRQESELHASILYSIGKSPEPEFLEKYGLRFKDTPKTAWQLFPLSFMVDRVVDISAVVQAAVNLADPSLKILAASLTKRLKRVHERQLISEDGDESWSVSITGDTVYEEDFSYIREVWHPSISDLVPPVTPGNLVKDAGSILDLIALSVQRLVK